MTTFRFPHLFLTLFALGGAATLPAQVLLLNPGSLTGVSTLSGSAPYTVAGTSVWNNGLTTYTGDAGVLQYADDSNATGVTVFGDGADLTSNAGSIDFATRTGNSVSTPSGPPNLFSLDPARDAVYTGSSAAATTGIFALKVSGLALDTTYDVYVVAAYTGSNSTNYPGVTGASRQAVFGFAGTESNSLSYNNGSITGAGSTVASYQALLNSNSTTWVENTNFEKFQLTLTADNPTLYILVSGQKSLAGVGGTSSEVRPWLNLVEIVAVPEPGTAGLLALGLGFLLFARRSCRL